MRGVLLMICGLLLSCPAGSQGRFPWTLPSSPTSPAVSAEVVPLGDSYRRTTSRVMIRRVMVPTRAALDLAAYWANILLHQASEEKIIPGEARVADPAQLFQGVLLPDTITANRAQLPLKGAEWRRPLAFDPLVDYLAQWDAERAAGLEDARAAVREESWGLRRRPGISFQQISTLYLHRPPRGAVQLWVKVEFAPWAQIFAGMPDEDGDGYPEIYGRLKPELASPEALARLEQDYRGRRLTSAEVHRWANQLASLWYPSYNTDVVQLQGQRAWPLRELEAEVKDEVKDEGLRVANPTVVIRGKPQGTALYNVFVVPGIAPMDGRSEAKGPPTSELSGVAVAPRLKPVRDALTRELKERGHSSWEAWQQSMAPTHRLLKAQLKRRPSRLKALLGKEGFLFYRNSLDYVVGGDLQAQPVGKRPLATIVAFKDYLKGLGVDFLLVPVPSKAEVYPDKLRGLPRAKTLPILNPAGRKFLMELTAAGVEVVDLLPRYLRARGSRVAGEGLLYQPQDTHWTDHGLRLASDEISTRIKAYAWYGALKRNVKPYTLKRASFRRYGDLHSRLASREQRRFKPARLSGQQVIAPDGRPYEDDPESPILILGDSFTGVFQRTDCQHAGISAHVAYQLSFPVDLVMSYGGGPNVRKKLLTRGEAAVRRLRLLIWVFAARDLYNYWEDWEPLVTAPSGAAPAKPEAP